MAAIALRVAEYSVCQGGDVRLAEDNGSRVTGADNMRKLLAAGDVSRAMSEIDSAHIENIEAIEQGKNGQWIVRLECSLWGDGGTERIAATPRRQSFVANSSTTDLRDHVEALLNSQ